MQNVVTEMSTTLSQDALWGVFGSVMPFIATTVLVGLGFYLIRKALKKVGKGKVGA